MHRRLLLQFLFDLQRPLFNVLNMNQPFSSVPPIFPARRSSRFIVWTMLALLLALCAARADGPDDDYVAIFSLINDADNLNKHGDTAQAHAKYIQARQELLALKQANPNWNQRIVSFRLNSLAEKIANTAEKPAETGAVNTGGTTGKTSVVAPAVKSQVKLLDAGAEPRTVLKLHPSAGDKQNLSMTMKMDMDMTTAGQSAPSVNIPAIVIGMAVEVKNVAPNGDIAYEVTYDDATVATDTNTLPAVEAAMKSALAGIKGMSATGKLSSHGIHLGMQMKLPPAADPQMTQIMNQMKDSFSSSSLPLPEEAVGVGAKWEYRSRLKSQGMTIDQTITSELVSLDGDHATLRNTITQNAANQKIQNPAMPGLKMDLTKLTGTGTGDSTLDLSRLLPVSATLDEKTETSMNINMGQKKQSMDMKMNINIALESK
jgi:hypothetical protein